MMPMQEPHVKRLEGKLWEMRMKGRDGIARAIYVTATRERVVVVHAFEKKTQKTPARALEIARERAKEVNKPVSSEQTTSARRKAARYAACTSTLSLIPASSSCA
jgi:phage-related protein